MHIKNLAKIALQTLSTPTPPPQASTEVKNHNFGFALVGNETDDEKAMLTLGLESAMQFCADMAAGAPARWLTLCGLSGNGKTLLAKSIRRFVMKFGEQFYNKIDRKRIDPMGRNYLSCYSYAQEGGFFVPWCSIIDTGREGDFSLFRTASRDWFKAIDDIGAADFVDKPGEGKRPSTFVVQQLGKLCDARIGKWTVLTSNFDRSQIAELFDVRIADRMSRDGNVIADMRARSFQLRLEALKTK